MRQNSFMNSYDIMKTAVTALNAKKAFDLKVIKVDDITVLTDYFVIVTGASTTQVKALANEVEYKLSESGVEPNHIEGKTSGWILLDYGSVVVHVFYKNDREFYSLDKMWQDGTQIDIDTIIEQ